MRKLQLRPRAAAADAARLQKTAQATKKKTRTRATLAVAGACLCLLAVGFGAWLRPGPSAFAQAQPEAVQPAPFDPLVIPADAYLKGAWSAVGTWPLIAVHLVLTPDGRVLSYGTDGTGKQTGFFIYDVWDSAVGLGGGHLTLPNGTGTDIFCGSQLLLPDSGSVFLAGGDNWTGTGTTNTGNNNSNLFNYNGNTLSPRQQHEPGALVLLLDHAAQRRGLHPGRHRRHRPARDPQPPTAPSGCSPARTPARSISCTRATSSPPTAACSATTARAGCSTSTPAASARSPRWASSPPPIPAATPARRCSRPDASCSSAATPTARSSSTSTAPRPTVTPTQSMSSQRRLVTATLLADGKVLATGGSQVWNELTGVNNIAEIWNPATGTWTRGHEGALARLYHSTALLLPDATVLVAGGGAPGPLNNLNAEIYYPPYLFTAAGTLAPRPAIATAPPFVEIGKTFRVDLAASTTVSRVTLVKTGSVTHSWNMDQRFQDLTFQRNGTQLSVQAPTRAALAPPGYYLLFVLDSAGVPSERQDPAHRRRQRSESRDHADPEQPRRPVRGAGQRGQPAACRHRSQWRCADFLGFRAAPGPHAQHDDRPDQRRADRHRHLRRRRHRQRRHQRGLGQLHLDRHRRRRADARPAAGAPARARRHRHGKLHRERQRRHQRHLPLGLRRRHADELVEPAQRHPYLRRARHLHRDRHR